MKRILIILSIFCIFLSGCAKDNVENNLTEDKEIQSQEKNQILENVSRTVFAMDTVMDVTAYDTSEVVMDKVESEISYIESLFSTTNENSEIAKINANKECKVSEDTLFVLNKALDYGEKTKGNLDISVYPIVKEWGFTTGDYKVPSDERINELLQNVDYTQVKIADEKVSIAKNMQIDLGSVVKGYTGDKIVAILKENGVKSALLNLGGNVQVLGTKTDGSLWRVAVQDPYGESYIGVVEVSDKCVITSGGYERYFTGDDGNIYWHIMDPFVGKPANNGLISTTIIADEGIYGDALSTALFVMGLDKAIDYWREHRDFETIMLDKDDNVYITEGLADNFKLREEYKDKKVTVIYAN